MGILFGLLILTSPLVAQAVRPAAEHVTILREFLQLTDAQFQQIRTNIEQARRAAGERRKRIDALWLEIRQEKQREALDPLALGDAPG